MLIPLVPWLDALTTWFFPVSSHCPPAAGARVIEFHVPATFQVPERRWLPREARGRLIVFPARGVRKSA